MNSPISSVNTASPAHDLGPSRRAQAEIPVLATQVLNQRENAEAIANTYETKNKLEVTDAVSLKGLTVIDDVFNFAKKIGRSACLVGGWVCSTAAVASMFFFNVKTFGLLFGIPAALFFVVATTLDKSTNKQTSSAMITDPLKAVSNLLENNTKFLRENPSHVIKVIQSVDEMSKNTQDYFDAVDRLEALREAILVDKAQLSSHEDELSLMYAGQMDDYLAVLDNILTVPESKTMEDDVREQARSMHSQAQKQQAL
ncbi:MAG: hypothetical protein O3C63_06695 [Cyanobacteria bacterium]|nr:hypothetical protein [Cyanobacteriota bacterium]MDA1021116.1 hypothetical protein [Cyanobacteriota bacterium]